MPDGGGIDYKVFTIAAHWVDATGFLNIDSRVLLDDHRRISYSPTNTVAGNFTAQFVHGEEPDLPLIDGKYMQDAMYILPDGTRYIGEIINRLGLCVIPPECKITLTPVVGQVLDVNSAIYPHAGQCEQHGVQHWKYRTLFMGAWGAFGPECVRTSLIEYNNVNVYNYVYKLGGGLVNFWYGQLSPDGMVIGYEYYALGSYNVDVKKV